MLINLLKSKSHRVNITDVHHDYEGSCAIDEHLLNSAKIHEYEMLHIYNLENGKRFTTYAIKAEKNSGIISLNGAASFMGNVGDKLIICTYAEINSDLVHLHKPTLVYFKENSNEINNIGTKIDTQKQVIKT